MNYRWFSIAVLAGTLLHSPSFVSSEVSGNELPDFGDSSGSLISPAQEMELGEAFMNSVRAQATLIHDPEISGYIRQLGERLVTHSDAPSYPFTFFVVKDPAVNAFAGPGGYIGIHTGLILTARNESELAGVMAHEIAHVTQRHLLRAYESANQMNLPSVAGMIAAILLGVATENADAGIAGVSAIQAGNIQRQLNFTRANEKEADRIGIQTLARSGIDPYGMPSFFERLHQSTRLYGNNVPEFLSTHPVTTDRIAESMSRAEEYGRGKQLDSLDFQLIRVRLHVLDSGNPQAVFKDYQSRVSKKSAGPADHYGLALAYWRNGADDKAQKLLLTLMDNDPDRAAYRTALAQIQLESGQVQEALDLYEDTLSLYPGDVIVGQYYAAALIQAGQAKKARDQVLKMLRNEQARTAETYKLWAKAASVSGPAWETNVASAEVYNLYGSPKLAIDQLKQALSHKGLSQYDQARIQARLKELQQILAARQQK
jgi:predicted Zn-dependent protease